MPTENRRVAAYLPKEIDEQLKAFKIARELATPERLTDKQSEADSQALIIILSEFFGVTHQLAQTVDYSVFVTAEQFAELTSKVSELSDAIQRSSSPDTVLNELLDQIEQLEKRIESLELVKNRELTLSVGELAKRLKMDSSTLSHWKSAGKKGKPPDELLKATRSKDPDGIGWTLIPEINRFKPERELPGSSSDVLQGELLNTESENQVNPLPEVLEQSEEH
jgi:DNA-binding transcriptional regulator YiaG